jgi:hypothetical protein
MRVLKALSLEADRHRSITERVGVLLEQPARDLVSEQRGPRSNSDAAAIALDPTARLER